MVASLACRGRGKQFTCQLLGTTAVPKHLAALSCQHSEQRRFSQRKNLGSISLFSSSTGTTASVSSIGGGERLRIAIVGGGAAGLSTALHLAPLVEAGLVAAPIDIYTIPKPKRDIGVGIWSTALDPFLESGTVTSPSSSSSEPRVSHQSVYDDMTQHGTWVGDVGYRTPNGSWLMKSHLPTSHEEQERLNMPALLFLRERDMLTALEKSAHWEQLRGTLQLHQDGMKLRVTGLDEDSSMPWSTKLQFDHDRWSSRDYHLIVAADGTNSLLRHKYGGHHDSSQQRILTGTANMGMGSNNDDNSSNDNRRGPSLSSPSIELPFKESITSTWSQLQQQDAVGLQDRNYTVFRGNSPLTNEEMGGADSRTSFQTWGTGRSMRFATVPMLYPAGMSHREERQVWFITIDDPNIIAEPDPSRRKALLLEAFRDWHDPIGRVVEATPAEEILMERAVAHRHSMAPVTNFNQVVHEMIGKRPPNSGEGPCVVFVGDANMTVDPILAQGFTVAMEAAKALVPSVQAACIPFPDDSSIAFHPNVLRQQLQVRYDTGIDRMICLLRATELVQSLGQPAGGTVSGFLNTKLLRPITRILPNFVKAPIFDATLRYSLGLLGGRRK